MSRKKQDRAYQTEIEDAVFNYLLTKSGNPVAVSPGGTGKSYVMAKMIRKFYVEWPGTRVMVLAQDAKLLDQNCNELLSLFPTAPCGIYSAGLRRRDTREPILFAGIQSVAKRAEEFGKINIIIIDECDLVSPKEETLYQKFIEALKEVNPRMRVIGFTATPYRLGMGLLTESDLWDEICIDLTATERFNWFVDNGFLAPLVNKRAAVEIDITNIAMKGGEFDEHALQEAADTAELNKAVVEECIRYGHDRKHWLVFSSGIKHGYHLEKIFRSRGISAVMLTGKDSMDFREEQEALFRSGKTRALINNGLYGRGWNFPEIDLIAWARATQSTSLWVQGCVRGTRTAAGKENCLILDFAGNTRRLGAVNAPIIPAPRRKGDAVKGEAPVKECPECHSYIHTRIMICPDCGYQFPPPQTIKQTAAEDEIMKSTVTVPRIVEHPVIGVRYKGVISKKNTYYFRVTYSVGVKNFDEFLFFDSGNALEKRRCRNWWIFRGGKEPIPEGVDEALQRAHKELREPDLIRVDMAPKYPRVVGCDFNENNVDVVDDDIPF